MKQRGVGTKLVWDSEYTLGLQTWKIDCGKRALTRRIGLFCDSCSSCTKRYKGEGGLEAWREGRRTKKKWGGEHVERVRGTGRGGRKEKGKSAQMKKRKTRILPPNQTTIKDLTCDLFPYLVSFTFSSYSSLFSSYIHSTLIYLSLVNYTSDFIYSYPVFPSSCLFILLALSAYLAAFWDVSDLLTSMPHNPHYQALFLPPGLLLGRWQCFSLNDFSPFHPLLPKTESALLYWFVSTLIRRQ